jgi:hypothetical protein
MDELGEPVFSDERTLAEEILQRTTHFSESIWPSGVPPEDAEERRAVVASWVARMRGGPTSTPPVRRFHIARGEKLGVYAALTEEAAASLTGLQQLCADTLTVQESDTVLSALEGRLPALLMWGASQTRLHAMVPVWRRMAAAGRPAGLIHLGVWTDHHRPPGVPAAPELPLPPLPPLGDLLPRLQSLHLCINDPEYAASWCAMLAGEGAPALAALTLSAPSRDALPDEQAAMYVDALRCQAGSLRGLIIQPLRMSAGAAEALDAAIVALPHLVNLQTITVQVDGGSVRVLGGRAPHLRRIQATCRQSLNLATSTTAWASELPPLVECIDLRGLCPAHESPVWGELAVAVRALGARSALRSLSLHMRGRDGVPWLQSVLSPPPDVAAAPVWPHLEELSYTAANGTLDVELDPHHFPGLRKIAGHLTGATLTGVMRNAACRDVWVNGPPFSLVAAADATALTPKERLVADLSDHTAEETVATLAGVVGGWPDLHELRLYAANETVVRVSEATQVALARALGHCTQLREILFPFSLCPAAATALAEVLPRLPEVTRIEVGDVTTTSLLALVRRLPGATRSAGDAARTLLVVVNDADGAPTTTNDLSELGVAVAAAGQRGWAIAFELDMHAVGFMGPTSVNLLSQMQALALRRDWRDCIVPLSTVDVTPGDCTLRLRPCGLVGWNPCE